MTDDVLPKYIYGKVVHGNGRGGAELGFPTANIDCGNLSKCSIPIDDGVYFGYCLLPNLEGEKVEPMVMSVGANTTFGITERTLEVHVLKYYSVTFYDENMMILVVGFIRPMYKFSSSDELIRAIEEDVAFTRNKLLDRENSKFKKDAYFSKKIVLPT